MFRKRPLPCPSRFSRDDSHAAKLLKILGPKRLAALQKAFGGRRIWVPKRGKLLPCDACRQRDPCIRFWRKKGYPVLRIAENLSISAKSIYRVSNYHTKSRR